MISATAHELEQADRWLRENLLNPTNLPYSFLYGGRRIAAQEGDWQFTNQMLVLDTNRTEFSTVLTDPETGLCVTATIVQNHRYPAFEWTLWFENTGEMDTPILCDVRAVDAEVMAPEKWT
jgi:alpha-galactosidase